MTAAIILIVLVLGGAGAFIIYEFKTRIWIWSQLPDCAVPKAKYVAPVGVTAAQVSADLNKVVECLATSTRWPRAEILRALTGCNVLVVNAKSWKNSAGVSVGGEQDGGYLKTCIDRSSLCHEAAHLCESVFTGTTDESHKTWIGNGIWSADNAYRAWASNRG